MKNTLYRVRTAGRDPAWLGVWCPSTGFYAWSRREKSLLLGRAEAGRVASAVEEAIAAKGYTDVRLLVVPATGGLPVLRR